MKRRYFTWVGGAVATAAAGAWLYRAKRTSLSEHQSVQPAESRYQRAIEKHLGHLLIDAATIEEFRAAWEAANGPFRGKDYALASTFLLSTDFFSNGEDESRTLTFTRIYDPYSVPCSNPLTYLD